MSLLKSASIVSLLTLASRITGLVRELLIAAAFGASATTDAFQVAFRIPNLLRRLFAEGAFSVAFIPMYSRALHGEGGEDAAAKFADDVLSVFLWVLLAFSAVMMIAMPGIVWILARDFQEVPGKFDFAVFLSRVTFPYLALVTLVVLWSGVLNAEKRFIEGAAAPVLLNLAMISTLLMAGLFATPAHAAAWGVLVAGFLEAGLLAFGAWRMGLIARPRRPSLDPEVTRFFKAFGPAVTGAAGVQIAMLADTIIVTFLPQGGASALYYADRLYQLPLGVIGVAAGTVLLPEMSRLISGGNETEAHRQQNRSLALSWLLAMPFFAAFLTIPGTIVSAMFERGAFGTAATAGTAKVLAAYAIGLPAIVAIRSIVASFHARGDTTTPLYASLSAIAVNLALKLVFWKSMGAAGLAIATAVGAIANFTILYALAWRQQKTSPDSTLALHASLVIVAAIWLLLRALRLSVARVAIWAVVRPLICSVDSTDSCPELRALS